MKERVKSILFDKSGNWEHVLKEQINLLKAPAKDEVQVRVTARPLNPSDEMFIEGVYRKKPVYPQVAGLEGAGIVTAVGESTFNSLIGQQVVFRTIGTWAEKININKDDFVIVPSTIAPEVACQLSLNAMTAYALLDEAAVKPNDWIILTAAAGTVGRMLIQLAVIREINVLAIVRKQEDFESLSALGAKEVITSDGDLETKIKTIVPKGVNAAIDAVGGNTGSQLYKVMSSFGKLIVYGRLDREAVSYYNAEIIYRNLTIKGFGIDAWLNSKSGKEKEQAWKIIIEAVMTGRLQIDCAEKYQLAEYKTAIKKYKSTGQKILLVS